MRFVRPTLLSEDRRILATLEHKPWTPAENMPWTAAFPWTGGIAVDAGSLALAVAPQVIVPLGDTVAGAPAAAEPAPAPDSARARQPAVATTVEPELASAPEPAPAPAPAPKRRRKQATAAQASVPAPAQASVPVPAPAPARAAKKTASAAPAAAPPSPEPAPAPAPASTATAPPSGAPARASNGAPAAQPAVVAVDPRSDELARALAATERDRDRALEQLAEAVAEREAAVRTRAHMEIAHDEALQAREAAESALARAKAERGEAIVQRDEALIAFRTLQRQLQAERAQADRETHGKQDEDTDTGEPLGVRTVPAVRGVMAELQYPRREQRLRLTRFDMWVVRVLGLAAAGCFFLLLFSILRVFL